MRTALIKDGIVSNIIVTGPGYTAPEGSIAVQATAATQIGGTWSGGAFGLAPAAPAPIVRLSRVEFMRRIGPTNWAALKTARAVDVQLDFALDQLFTAAWIEPSHAETQQLGAYCVAMNYLSQGDVDVALVNEYLPGETGP